MIQVAMTMRDEMAALPTKMARFFLILADLLLADLSNGTQRMGKGTHARREAAGSDPGL
jgi:hypothetical protein